WAGGRQIDVGHARQRAVLAALLVDAGQVVTWEALIDRVWGDLAPADPRAGLRVYVARLRRTLEGVRLSHRSGGYLLEVDRDQVDLHRFRRLVHGIDQAPSGARAALLREAVELWRGTP